MGGERGRGVLGVENSWMIRKRERGSRDTQQIVMHFFEGKGGENEGWKTAIY